MITIQQIIKKKTHRLFTVFVSLFCIQLLVITIILYVYMSYIYELTSSFTDMATITMAQNPLSHKNINKYSFIPVSVTAYSPDPKETDNSPYINASNKVVADGTCALSPNIEARYGYKFGQLVTVYGIGIFIFTDRTNAKLNDTVDIFFFNKKKCLDFGRKYGILVVSNKSIRG